MRFSHAVAVAFSLVSLFECSVAQVDSADSSRPVTSAHNLDILSTARELATTAFDGFRYGSNIARKRIDCSQFMQAVIEKVVGRELTQEESRAMLISGLPSGARTLDSLIESDDERITGVRYALTKVIPIGRIIKADSVRPGDLIQYWIKSSSGHYKGHTAIVESVEQRDKVPVVTLYGSHKTLGRIGTAVDRGGKTLKLKLQGKDRKAHVVRIDPELLARERASASNPTVSEQKK